MRQLLCKMAIAQPRGLLSGEFFRYLMVSAVALALDWGLLIFLTEVVGLHYLFSAAIGFCAGLACAYVQSIAFVFRTRSLSNPRWEFALFCVIGIVGLGLTQLMLYFIVAWTGVSYALAKGPVAGVIFVVNFGLRRVFLFSNPAATSETVVQATAQRRSSGTCAATAMTATMARGAGAEVGAERLFERPRVKSVER